MKRQRLYNITHSTGEAQGPYLAEQIVFMAKSGGITADSTISRTDKNEEIALSAFLETQGFFETKRNAVTLDMSFFDLFNLMAKAVFALIPVMMVVWFVWLLVVAAMAALGGGAAFLD